MRRGMRHGCSSECDGTVAQAAAHRSSLPIPVVGGTLPSGSGRVQNPRPEGLRSPFSDSHGALERSFVNGLARARIHDGAAVHHGEVVAELERKVEILLDQHGCDLAEVAQIRDGAADGLDDRGLDAFSRLVKEERARPHHQRAADRELLLLAAGEVTAAPAEHAVEHREEREHVVRDGAVLALERCEAGLEILLDREQRKNLATLRHIGDAAARAVGGLERSDILAVEADAATADRLLAGESIKQTGLADAVAAEHASHFAGLGGERDRAQRLRCAVVQVDGLCLKHRYRPRYTSITRWFAET